MSPTHRCHGADDGGVFVRTAGQPCPGRGAIASLRPRAPSSYTRKPRMLRQYDLAPCLRRQPGMPNAALALPLHERSFDDLLEDAVRFHGHACPGQVLGVRMARAGCREIGIDDPRTAGKSLVVFVEVDRCAVDAIQALTGVSLGKRTLKFLDYGKAAATFVNTVTGRSVRVAARESARARAAQLMLAERDARRAMIAAYRVMEED